MVLGTEHQGSVGSECVFPDTPVIEREVNVVRNLQVSKVLRVFSFSLTPL